MMRHPVVLVMPMIGETERYELVSYGIEPCGALIVYNAARSTAYARGQWIRVSSVGAQVEAP